jgi:hypothetical protein
MDFSGTKFPAANITIFEGNVPAQNSLEGAGYTAARFPGVNMLIEKSFDKSAPDPATGEANGYATTLKNADFFMNVFGLRGHDNSYAEGVTLGGKSHYGTYSNAKMIHTSPALSIRCAHMICSGVVFKKQVLSVCAGLLSNKKGSGINAGPTDYSTYTKKIDPTSTTKATSTIIMSTDPVSADMQAVKVMQINDGKTYGISDMPKYVQACAGVSGALSGVSYNIGIIDESKMSITKIINEEIVSPVKVFEKNSSDTKDTNEYLLSVSSLSRQGVVHIDYTVPFLRKGDRSSIFIYDVLGNLLFSKDFTLEGGLNSYVWDLQTKSRGMVGRGKYLCKLKIGRITRSSMFTVL